METKDFLFLNYSWVPNSTFIFESFLALGHTGDIVDEKTINSFQPLCKYKAVILYLHEGHTIPITNQLLKTDALKDSYLIQHDDTDFEDIQVWSEKTPDLIMQRELTQNSFNPHKTAIVYPMHFPIPSLYNGNKDKDIDVFFFGTLTNQRRLPFVKHIISLAEGKLSHLNWAIKVTPADVRTPEEYKELVNRCKIGMHYFGNSWDSWRIWELASCGASIVMPELPLLSIKDEYMPFETYTSFSDFQQIETIVENQIESGDWKTLGEKAKKEYDSNHTPEKCFDYYYNKVMKHCPVEKVK